MTLTGLLIQKNQKQANGQAFLMSDTANRWCLRTKSIFPTSTCNKVYLSWSTTCKKSAWLRHLLLRIVSSCTSRISSFSNVQSAVKPAVLPGMYHRSKHIEVTFLFVRDTAFHWKVWLLYIDKTYKSLLMP